MAPPGSDDTAAVSDPPAFSPTRRPRPVELGAITAVATAGPVVIIFWVLSRSISSVMADLPLIVSFPLGLVTLFALLPAGGGLFGWGVARFVGAPRRRAVVAGALALYLTVVAVELPVHMSQILIDPLRSVSPWGPHALFAAVFAAEVALVLTVTTGRVLLALGIEGRWHIARRVGTAASAGFAAPALLAIPLGWTVGTGVPEAVVDALHLGTTVAGFIAGTALAHCLRR